MRASRRRRRRRAGSPAARARKAAGRRRRLTKPGPAGVGARRSRASPASAAAMAAASFAGGWRAALAATMAALVAMSPWRRRAPAPSARGRRSRPAGRQQFRQGGDGPGTKRGKEVVFDHGGAGVAGRPPGRQDGRGPAACPSPAPLPWRRRPAGLVGWAEERTRSGCAWRAAGSGEAADQGGEEGALGRRESSRPPRAGCCGAAGAASPARPARMPRPGRLEELAPGRPARLGGQAAEARRRPPAMHPMRLQPRMLRRDRLEHRRPAASGRRRR